MTRLFTTSAPFRAKKLTIPKPSDEAYSALNAEFKSITSQQKQQRPHPRGEIANEDLKRYETTLNTRGMIYSPADLSFEAKRPLQQKNRQSQITDKFEEYSVNPMDEYKSFNLLSQFTTELGRIRTREQTGLSTKNQRRLGKAIRRARALSILPTAARHPEYSANGERRNNPSMNYIARG
ncbi:37S ribosomal protein rsm18,mitochondrial [Taphrina deformans PYCC 5710]|uniref:Small ribosomal subunit protein bS18m n=1 Tax=Taphrina deformans (strain PYCC 5710 / ATCC 11124 / CBS 356.35 / IMI 108563 / JCM 9778 / NBRC 8474) TaxID=1097556 RepID=R4X8R1_TAPDE|nr:37S ribosomal protein rsm18,mitochondrial [Taphrina deformans PYCC 5710]|eukprot:CCG82028.1 37S ribosomal protein rsm18,mitochondrial [Taphrina deformans PYCC 5710]